jgi:hypothetical protein
MSLIRALKRRLETPRKYWETLFRTAVLTRLPFVEVLPGWALPARWPACVVTIDKTIKQYASAKGVQAGTGAAEMRCGGANKEPKETAALLHLSAESSGKT